MAETPTCRKCGVALSAYAPPGLCANCMLQQGFDPAIVPATWFEEGGAMASARTSSSLAAPAKVRYFGDYELLEEIARGGMGIVYRARQVSLDRMVAVKMLLSGPFSSPELVKRFRAEASAAASLQHPNIVAIHEVGVHQGLQYFAMDFVEGQSLAKLLAGGPLPARRAASYLKTIAEAIHYAHERGLLHRDLKPSNVLIDAADQPRVTDFGLARRLEGDSELTLSGQVLGSPNYMPPEQAGAKRGQLSRRSDVYALGAMLYHLLTGRPPFVGETIADTLGQVINSEPVPPRLLNPSVPRDLETLCLKCLEKEPGKRYPTAQALAEELSRFLGGEPIAARPVSRFEKTWRWCRRKPGLSALSAASVLLLLALAIGSPIAAFRINRERQRADQNLYDSDMRLAQLAWDESDLGRTRSLLQAHLPRPGERDRRGFEWFYFWKLCEGDQRMTLIPSSAALSSIAFSPDGKRLATGSAGDDDPVQIWDSASGILQQTLPKQNVISLAFAPNGDALGVGGRDRVVVWNLQTGQAAFKHEEVMGQFRIAFLPVGTLLAIGKRAGPFQSDAGSASAELRDYVTGDVKQVFPQSSGYIALSPRGDRLATGGSDNTTRIWELATGKMVGELQTGWAIAMALSPDGQTLATSGRGAPVSLWDVTTGQKIGSLADNQRRIWSLAFSSDGRLLATGGADQTVSLWDVATSQRTEHLKGHGGEVMSVAFSPDGQTLASGSKDNTAMLWRFHSNRAVAIVSNVVSRAIFSPDSRLVAAGMGRNQAAVWDVATLELKAVFADAFDAVAFSPDGRTVMTRGTNYFLRTFDVATQAIRRTISNGPALETYSFGALSPDGRILATGLPDGTLTFSEAKTGAWMAPNRHAYSGSFFQLAFSTNGKLLATVGRLGVGAREVPTPKVWDVATHTMVAAPAGHIGLVLDVVFAPDGKTLVTCGLDNLIRFWDTTTWQEVPPSIGQRENVSALAFSPNGRRLATARSDGIMKIWNVATRRELASLEAGAVHYVTFSPDGQTLAAFDWDRSLRLWRAPIPDKKQSHPGDD